MHVDHQTLRDLEVKSTPGGTPDLLDFLNRARTRGGRDAFRRRLTRPLSSARSIAAVQETLRFITGNRGLFDSLPDDTQVLALHRYLDSRFTTLKSLNDPGLAFESWWVRRRYPELYREALRGTKLVADFLSRIANLLPDLEEAPEPLADYLAECRLLVHAEAMTIFTARRRIFTKTRSVFLQDNAAREKGRAALSRLIELIHEIDALVSMADATAERDYVFPLMDADFDGISFSGLRHPFLTHPTENEFSLVDGARLLFLTGPNMAGKSTYLKSVGLAVILAHAGMGVPARSGRLGVFHRVITAIRTEDDLRQGVSYFQAEARRVRDIARHLTSGERCLVIGDELFRGTNVKDACDASLTVLATFAATPHGRFVIASHLTELADELRAVNGVVFRRFEAAVAGQSLAFDYQLKEGVSTQRLGMLVLDREGVIEVLALVRGMSHDGDHAARGA